MTSAGMNAPIKPGTAQKLFLEYNRRRRQMAVQAAPKNAPIALNYVPLLLHYNHASMPCRLEAPGGAGGIDVFELTDDMRQSAAVMISDWRAVEKDLNFWRPKKILIESLMLMGSVGTAAQNAASDYDYWVVVDEKRLTPEEMDWLQRKLAAVETWAAEKHGLELHFFITDIDRVRANNFGSVDHESAGSSQARLLKEEFYRTCIHVAGKYPAWWLTPPGADDAGYVKALQGLQGSFDVDPRKYVDLGNVSVIPGGEMFGAALWQINKALASPFKSVLKIALLETLIDPEGTATLLCDELKRNVLAQNAAVEEQDPYLLMMDHLLMFYGRKKRHEVVDILRKCLYNKVKVKVNAQLRKKPNLAFKEEAMVRYAERWGWDDARTGLLNNYEEWNFDQMVKLGTELHGFLLETYKRVTDELKGREDVKAGITDEDLTVLGRKIFSFYKRKPGKIDPVKKASDDALRQESITFMPQVQMGKKPAWTVYRGNVSTDVARRANVEHTAVRKSASLAELVCWLAMNQIIDGGTFLHLIPNPLPVHLKTIQELLKGIIEFMPPRGVPPLDNSALLKSEQITGMMVIANFVSQPWTKEMEETVLLYRNSHGETFCEALDAKAGAERLTALVRNMVPGASANISHYFRVFTPRTEHSAKIEKALRLIFTSRAG
ncbi:MAG: class I adenylate cyclase [Nitrospinae bacterium]|nr:class I adenylate cyclase [Nitrospinota bacterium]